jgi:hypothetical protein
MKSRDAKIKFFSWTRRWALALGIALMLVASPQVWAGVACLCDPQLGRQDSCQTAHRSDAAAEMQGESSASETSTPCESDMQATCAFQSPSVTMCCIRRPQSKPAARFVPAAPQVDTAPVRSADSLPWPTRSGTAHTFNLTCKRSKRPLYLAFSCLLI